MEQNKSAEINTDKSKTGVVYITDNENMFIAPEGIPDEEYRRISLKTDIKAMKEKIDRMQKDLSAMSEPPHEQEIERTSPYEVQAISENKDLRAAAIPAFSLMTKNGMKTFENMKFQGFLDKEGMYLLDNGTEQLKIPVKTFETIMEPQKAHPVISNAKTVETAEESPAIVNGVTILPEFAMITANGIETFKDLKVDRFNAAENSYTLKNVDSTLVVTGETFSEIIRPDRFDKQHDENGPAYEKLINSQYENYFKQRDNTANNFRHNLSVYCRKEANSPLDALTISKEIISRMSKEEKEKTRLLLNQIKKEDETINQLLIRTYYEAIKEVPLDKEKVLNQNDEKMIAKPFYDTINGKGQPVDENSTLKIGDTVKDLAFNVPNAFGHGKTKIFEDLTVISSSKEGNNVILMDKNRSFYEVPRDSLLEGYNRQQEKQQKAEQKHRMSNRIDVGWER